MSACCYYFEPFDRNGNTDSILSMSFLLIRMAALTNSILSIVNVALLVFCLFVRLFTLKTVIVQDIIVGIT